MSGMGLERSEAGMIRYTMKENLNSNYEEGRFDILIALTVSMLPNKCHRKCLCDWH